MKPKKNERWKGDEYMTIEETKESEINKHPSRRFSLSCYLLPLPPRLFLAKNHSVDCKTSQRDKKVISFSNNCRLNH